MQSTELAVKEQQLIELVLVGEDFTKAAKMAGFTNTTRDAQQVFIDPRAVAYAYKKTRGRMMIEGAPAAYQLMLRVLKDEKQDMRLRVDVAKTLLASGGYGPPKAANAAGDDVPDDPKDMTAKEIERFVKRVQAEMNRRREAQTIDVTPASSKQPIEDMF